MNEDVTKKLINVLREPENHQLQVKHSTKLQTKLMVGYIVGQILALKLKHDIVGLVMEKYRIKEAMCYRLIKRAQTLIDTRPIEQNIDKLRASHIQLREQLARTTRDDRVRLECLKDIAKLQGIDTNTINVNVRNTGLKDVDEDTLIAIMTESKDA